MIRRVDVAPAVHKLAHDRFGETRSASGDGSEYDFVGGPLAAAAFAFRQFDELSFDLIPAVRSYTVVDPIFGTVTWSTCASCRARSTSTADCSPASAPSSRTPPRLYEVGAIRRVVRAIG